MLAKERCGLCREWRKGGGGKPLKYQSADAVEVADLELEAFEFEDEVYKHRTRSCL